MTEDRTALVLGATGGVGGEVARRLRDRGWRVRALHRRASERAATGQDGLDWTQGDAMRPADVVGAAEGAAVIVHAVNPPGYRKWDQLVLPMVDSTIAAADASGARIVLPGTVYNYGPDAFPRIAEDAPQRPLTRKGRIRVELERRLEAAARDTARGARALVVRAGDFFGPTAVGNSWFAQGFVKPGRRVARVTQPGAPGTGHQWGYLPDVGETIAALIARDRALDDFATFHMGGHWDADGAAMVDAIRAAVGATELRVRRFPWWAVAALSPIVPMARELREMRYLWRAPVRLDNRRLVATLGREPHTPLREAVRATLVGLGCLGDAPAEAGVAHG